MSTASASVNIQDNFFLRRLHSITGMFPLGVFVLFHLSSNSLAIFSPEKYTGLINFLRSTPFLEEVEIAVLLIPILFHSLYGLIISKSSKPNVFQYSHLENWRYVFQRTTGVIILIFMVYHVLQFRFVENLDYNYVAAGLAGNAYFDFMPAIPFINPLNIYWFYVIGLFSTTYHFAHGLWSFCITWGITVGSKSQTVVAWIATGFFLVLSYISISSLNSLKTAGEAMLGAA